MTLTTNFVKKILDVDFRSLPAEAVDMSKQVVLDGLGVIMAGSTETSGLGKKVIQYTREMGGLPDATVVAGGFKTSVLNAAYANGTMAHALDFDNTWYPLNHPTSPTLPAILALAEKYKLSGPSVIESIVTAFEVQARLRLAATGMATGKKFHKPGMTGTIGATAAAIKLLQLDEEQALMALGIAGSRAGSLAINTGTMTKSSHSGHAARMGVECAVLAKMGWTATKDVFGPGGFFEAFMGNDAEPELLVKDFGQPFRMIDPGVGFKKYPCNYFTHRPIDAVMALHQQYDIEPSNIQQVRVTFPRFEYVNRPQPRTGLDGKFSVQYTTAVALLDKEITVDSFTNERRFADDLTDLLPRVELVFDDKIPFDFEKMHVVVDVRLKDGRRLSEKVARLTGMWGVPLTREQRLKKFYSCSQRVIEKNKADRLLQQVEILEDISDVKEMMAIVRA